MSIAEIENEAAFGALTERHRRELQIHCYRMLGSLQDAEDAVQETFLRAWRRRDTYEGRAPVRAWLYRIATNACLDALDRRPRKPSAAGEILWLQPYPDQLLEGVAPSGEEPDAAVVAKETIELAFMTAIQHLPPRQRAALILRDVLGWSAKETAALLEVSVASANSALQRARAGLKQHLPEQRLEWAAGEDPTEAERALLARYVEAGERGDVDGLAATVREDVRFSMPPLPGVWTGRDEVVGRWRAGGFGTDEFGQMRCVLTRANRQPAVACYVRQAGEERFKALAIDVLRVEEGAIADIVVFDDTLFSAFGLPAEL